ncbi:MAG TPA: outer membrane beta-barrel protein [Pyrinomonadaceae bacterium]|jgi:opacity protein-like surface antigen
MKTIFAIFILLISSVSSVFAQADEISKGEFFAGYSINRTDVGATGDAELDDFIDEGRNFQGFNFSGVYNFSKYVGLKADVSGHYKNFRADIPGLTNQPEIKASLYNVLGGVQIKNNSKERRVKPFAHALAGAGIVKARINDSFCQEALGTSCPAELRDSETAFSMAFGGGLDVRASRRVSFRVFQVDYNPIRKDGQTSNNVRFSFGIVFH